MRSLALVIACALRAGACALLLGACALLAGGCAHADAAADRHLEDMRDSIGKLEAEQDRKVARVDESPAARPAASAKPAGARTVQLGEDEPAGESDDPNDPTARPEIRLQGTAMGRPARSKSRGREDEPRRPADDNRPSVLDPEAKRAYDAALAQVNAKQCDRALESLAAFLVRYPDHPYAENATYWRGECYFARGEYLRAAEQFEAVLARFAGNKAPDALLKLGICHDRLGSPDRAREYWERLRRDYPRSDAAKRVPSSDAKGPKESR